MNRQRIQIVCVLCAAGMTSQFYSTVNSVLAEPVMGDIGLTPTAYGSMTVAYFVAFMRMQLPAGILFDRYGPRLTISGLLLMAVAGAIVFALGDSLTLAHACACTAGGRLCRRGDGCFRRGLGLVFGSPLDVLMLRPGQSCCGVWLGS